MAFLGVLQPSSEPRLGILAFLKSPKQSCAVRKLLGGIVIVALRAAGDKDGLAVLEESGISAVRRPSRIGSGGRKRDKNGNERNRQLHDSLHSVV